MKIGDVVKLNSGGPEMTVSEDFANESAQSWQCTWFVAAAGKFESAVFPQAALELIRSS